MIAIVCKAISSIKSKSIGPLLGEIYMAKVKTPHKCHIGQERVNTAFPLYLWDLLLPQAKLTVNLLQQATINPKISAWEYFNGTFDFNKTPLAPVGCRVLIHAKPATCKSWDYRAKQGFYMGPALEHYRRYELVKLETNRRSSPTQWSSGMLI